jgi:hypothetical protein
MSGLKKDMGAIQRAVQILAGTYDKDFLRFEVANVQTVDTKNWLCSAQLISGNVQTTYNNIRLTAEKASNGFIQVPKKFSNIILAITWRNEVYVFMCSEIDALVFHQKNSDGSYEEFVINCNSGFNSSIPLGIQIIDGGGNGVLVSSVGTITINDSSYGGLVEVAPLVSAISTLQNQFNDLKNLFNTHIHTGGTLSGSTGVPTVLDSDPMITPTSRSDIENMDITHGPKT